MPDADDDWRRRVAANIHNFLNVIRGRERWTGYFGILGAEQQEAAGPSPCVCRFGPQPRRTALRAAILTPIDSPPASGSGNVLSLALRLLCCGQLALVLSGCADDAARLMYRSQSELMRHRRLEAVSAERKRAAERLKATLAEGDARQRTLDELQAALTACLK